MAKWYGAIGYSTPVETEPGVWIPDITEQLYFGDVSVDYRKRQSGIGSIDDINLTNMISMIADQFAIDNCANMVYAEINGTKWKINNVEVNYPRLVLTVGGVYNG